jgi:hypothetical protein
MCLLFKTLQFFCYGDRASSETALGAASFRRNLWTLTAKLFGLPVTHNQLIV